MKNTAKNWRNGERNWDPEKRRWKKNLPGNCRNRKFSLKWLESRNALTLQHKAGFPNSTQSPAFTPLAPNSGNCCRFFHIGNSPSSSSNPTGSAVYIKGPHALYFQWRQSVSGSVSLLLWAEEESCWCMMVMLCPSDVSRISGGFISVSKRRFWL